MIEDVWMMVWGPLLGRITAYGCGACGVMFFAAVLLGSNERIQARARLADEEGPDGER